MLPSGGDPAGGRSSKEETKNEGTAAAAKRDAAYVTSITDIDIILGRGRFLIQLPGNVAFRELCRTRKAEYLNAVNRSVKDQIARELIQEVDRRKGRFLRKIETPEEAKALGVPEDVEEAWKVVDFSVALEKTKQTLRDKEYIRNNDRTAGSRASTRTATTSDNATGTPRENNSFSQLHTAGTHGPLQRQSSVESSTGQEGGRPTLNQQHLPQSSPSAATPNETVLLSTLQQEQNRLQNVQDQLAYLRYQEQFRQSAAAGLPPNRLLEQQLLELQSRQAAPHLLQQQQQQQQTLAGTGFHSSSVEQRLLEEMRRQQQQGQPQQEQKSDSQQQNESQGLPNSILSQNRYLLQQQLSQAMMHPLNNHFGPQGFSPMVEQRLLEMQRQQQFNFERGYTNHFGNNPSQVHQDAAGSSGANAAQNMPRSQMPFLPSDQLLMPGGMIGAAIDPRLMSLLQQQQQMNGPLPASRNDFDREQVALLQQQPRTSDRPDATSGQDNISSHHEPSASSSTHQEKKRPQDSAASSSSSSSSGETAEEKEMDTKPAAKKSKK